MTQEEIKILLIEDNPDDVELISILLARSKKIAVRIGRAARLSEAMDLLAKERFDIVLSDLGLPDSRGMDTFTRINAASMDTPVIVLTGLDDEEIASEAVRQGAQDYIVKDAVNAELLAKAVRYAIERLKLVVELKNRMSEIGKLERERQNMLSMLAHDIKNALVPAVGFLERILSGKTDKMQDRLERVHGELMAISTLVTNFEDFARYEATGYTPHSGPCDLDGIIRTQIESALVTAEKKGIAIRYEPGAGLPPLRADTLMIKRVVMNLLDNAVKYTDPGGSVVVLALEKEKEVLVEVRDTGRGIPPDKLPYVFDAFYRATRDQKGSGLGLAIIKTIIEAHGGRSWATSTLGKGSTFGFSLPQ
jgi:signal transduction histidine kinase